ncbi:MAG TPA: DUF4870 domain-containing protein [Gemmatimonadota bacterium]|nr:DUF4870 domain-containing protein [Gemmatimonadota bacterium]
MNEHSTSGETTGMDPRLAGLLAYLVPPITGIIFYLIEKRQAVVRWHAAQSIVFGVAWIVLWIVFSVLSMVLSTIPILGWIITLLIWVVLFIGGLVLWVICLIKGYSGEIWRMPFLAQYADRIYGSGSAGPGNARSPGGAGV